MGSSGMRRKGRRRLQKVHHVRPAPTAGGMLRTWFLKHPEDQLPGPLVGDDPMGVMPWGPFRWLGFTAAIAGISLTAWFERRRRKRRDG